MARDLAETTLFQSHAGSIEAKSRRPNTNAPKAFQSHAGSIEANSRTLGHRWCDPVSIPRWFD